ncbi:C-type lectin domain family 3 member A-like [Trematomus bernacchii]|uniref:C-type lectin domain family 3 member A-like n=1 Tax=Trematomus bernacchii TaxID=40690 RepID=UPI00146A1CF9|nr:C-type lectin domain family 3 member A-like [Trematomus bernacchii]
MKGKIIKDLEEITEEADYVNAPEGPADKKATRPEDTKKEAAPEGTVDTKASPPGLRFFLPIAVCWIILLAIMGLRIYLTSELSEDNAKQTAEILNLTSRIQELETWKNLTVWYDNLIQAYTVLESNVKNLNKLNQELETKKNNLTQQIQNMETTSNELNVSRAQWSIDSYCLTNKYKKCQPCQVEWYLTQPSCYAMNDPPSPGWITWEEAREDCKGKNSDLAVAHNPAEKNDIIDKYSPNSSGTNGFWIGLRVEDGKWKWADGSDLTNSSWIDPPVDGRCAMSVKFRNTWSSVSCEEKHQWICQKKALTLSV